MKRLLPLVVIAVLGAGTAVFFSRYRIAGWNNLGIEPREAADADGPDRPPVRRESETIRIATFNLHNLDAAKLTSMTVSRVLVEVVRQFDVVAVQEVRPDSREVLRQLVEKVNADGRNYDYIVPSAITTTGEANRLAFLYDQASVEYDDRSVQRVSDPAGRLRQEPLLALFRVRGPQPSQAFTFALINVQTDPDRAMVELDALAEVFRAVRQHTWDQGLAEDDVILLGDLNADDGHLGRLGEVPQLTPVTRSVRGVTSTMRGRGLADNILFRRADTVEFTGRWGVVDLIEEFELSPEEALEVSDRLPMWVEFSIHEGGRSGPLALRPVETPTSR